MRRILLKQKNVHLGLAAERELQNLLKCGKINQGQVLNLRKERWCLSKHAVKKWQSELLLCPV